MKTGTRHPMSTSAQHGRTYANLEGQEKKVDDQAGNDTDVNNIVARFARTGIFPPPPQEAQYADVTHMQGDLAALITKGKEAEAELAALTKADKAKQQEQIQKDQAELKRLREALSASSAETVDSSENP